MKASQDFVTQFGIAARFRIFFGVNDLASTTFSYEPFQ
jgi:hypothetical protein